MPGVKATCALFLLGLCIFQVEAGWFTNTEKTNTESAVQKVSEQAANGALGRKGALAERSWALEEDNLDLEEDGSGDYDSAYNEEVVDESEQQEEDAGWLGFLGLGSKSGAKKEAPLMEDDKDSELLRTLKPDLTVDDSVTAGELNGLSKPQLLGGGLPLSKAEEMPSKTSNWVSRSSTVPLADGEGQTEDSATVEGLVGGQSQRKVEAGLTDKPLTSKTISGWFSRTSKIPEEDEVRQTEEDKIDEVPLEEQTQGKMEAGLADSSLTPNKVASWFTRPSTSPGEDEATQTEDDETAAGLRDQQTQGKMKAGLAEKSLTPKNIGGWFTRSGTNSEQEEAIQPEDGATDKGPFYGGSQVPETGLADKSLAPKKVGSWFARPSTIPVEDQALQVEDQALQTEETDEGLVNNPEELSEAEVAANENETSTAYGEQPPKGWRGWGLFAGKTVTADDSEGALDVPLHKSAVAEALAVPDRVQATLPETEGLLTEEVGNEIEEEGQSLTQVQTSPEVRGSVANTWGRLTAPKEEGMMGVEEGGEPVQEPYGLQAAISQREGPLSSSQEEGSQEIEDGGASPILVQTHQRAWGPIPNREGPRTVAREEEGAVGEEGESLLEVQKAARNTTAAALKAAILPAIGQVTNGTALTDTEAAKKLIFELFGSGKSTEGGAMPTLNAGASTQLDNDTSLPGARNDSANFSQTLYQMGVYKTNIGAQNAFLRPSNTSNSTAEIPRKETSFWGGLFGGAGQNSEASEEESREALVSVKPSFSEGISGSIGTMEGVLEQLSNATESGELPSEEAVRLEDGRLAEENEAGEVATMLRNVTDEGAADSETGVETLPFGIAQPEIVDNEPASEGPQLPSNSSGFTLTTSETPEEESDQLLEEGSDALESKSLAGATFSESNQTAGEEGSDSGYWNGYEDEGDKEEAAFFENLFNPQTLGAVHEKAKAHLVPQVQALSQATTDAYDSTHKQLKASLDGVVGTKASGFTASLIVMLLLLVPGAAVVFICHRLKAVFSLQTSIFVCSSYLALYSLVLSLIALVYKEPLSVFQRSYPGAYVMFQFLSLLAYVIFLALCATSCWAALKTREPLQQALGVGQLLPALAIGVHYFGTVWQPAMLDKPPHVNWTVYAVYTIASSIVCLMTWFRRSRHEVLASGGSVYKQL